jgi:hypothetical protein
VVQPSFWSSYVLGLGCGPSSPLFPSLPLSVVADWGLLVEVFADWGLLIGVLLLLPFFFWCHLLQPLSPCFFAATFPLLLHLFADAVPSLVPPFCCLYFLL